MLTPSIHLHSIDVNVITYLPRWEVKLDRSTVHSAFCCPGTCGKSNLASLHHHLSPPVPGVKRCCPLVEPWPQHTVRGDVTDGKKLFIWLVLSF